jgi:hypothetical protein
MPSAQLAAAQKPSRQTPAQSESEAHATVGHAAQVPPQSVSVSSPLRTLSAQPGGAQTEAAQTRDWQSVA